MNQPDSARLGSDSTPLGSTPLDPSVRPNVRPNVRAPPLRPPCSSFIFSLCFVFISISIIVITVYPYSIKEHTSGHTHIGTLYPHRDTLPTSGHPIRNVAMTFYAMTFYAMTFSLCLSQSLSLSYKKPTERE